MDTKKVGCLVCLLGRHDAWCSVCFKGMCLKCYTSFLLKEKKRGLDPHDLVTTREFYEEVSCKCWNNEKNK